MSNLVTPRAVLALGDDEVEVLVQKFEADGGQDVNADQIQLLERFFLTHPDHKLGKRYEAALQRQIADRA